MLCLCVVGRNGISIFQIVSSKYNWDISHVDYFTPQINTSLLDVRQQLHNIKNTGEKEHILVANNTPACVDEDLNTMLNTSIFILYRSNISSGLSCNSELITGKSGINLDHAISVRVRHLVVFTCMLPCTHHVTMYIPCYQVHNLNECECACHFLNIKKRYTPTHA